MEERAYRLNLILCALWGSLLALFVICRTFYPAIILPAMDIPLLLAVSLGALLVELWLGGGRRRTWGAMTALAAVTFGLLPLCAGLTNSTESAKLAVAGGLTFLVSAVLFDSIADRSAFGPNRKSASALSAFVLFLASQAFTNLFF